MGRILGLDWGTRGIVVAVSDPMGITAQRLTTIRRRGAKRDIEEIIKIIGNYEVSEIVVGLPLDIQGALGPEAKRVMGFVERLRAGVSIPVHTWDERYSTKEAKRRMFEGGLGGRKIKVGKDVVSAQLILQGFLEAKRLTDKG